MIVPASIVIVFIIGWLVHYTMSFMLAKRSRELGTYILLGLENKQVSRLFLLENLLIGFFAFLIGLVLGNLIFQYMRVILLRMYDVPFHFHFTFSLLSISLTLLYFAAIYSFALLKSRKRIRRMKIYDLIYFERQNENAAIKKNKNRRVLFNISIICGIAGIPLLIVRQVSLALIGSVLIILFIYGFFISFSSGIPAFFNKRPVKKYSKTNLIIFRFLSSKLTTMGITMATITLLFTGTLLSEGSGILFSNMFSRSITNSTSYDLFISCSADSDLTEYKKYIDSHIDIRNQYEYHIYSGDNDILTRYIQANTEDYHVFYEQDTLLRVSDYMALRKMLGFPEIHLPPDSYIIHCRDILENLMRDFDKPLTIGNQTLTPSSIHTENFTQSLWDGNGTGFILVVPDEVAEARLPVNRIYAAMTNEPVHGKVIDGLYEIRTARNEASENYSYDTILSPAAVREEYSSMYAMIVFPLFYLALILTMTAATILTIQLLSDIQKYQRHYHLLNNLGMDKKDMLKSLRCQFAWFYILPIIPSSLLCIFFMLSFKNTFDFGVITGWAHLWGIIGSTFLVFFVIYLIYIVASYMSFKRNTMPV